MPDLYPLARQLLWRLQPETAHKVALRALRAGLGFLASNERSGDPDHPSLAQSLWGLHFDNPVGVAAGFDKDALVPDKLLQRGFGAVEVGTVTPRKQPGNEMPRLFRLDRDNAIINRMGFPSAGLDVVAKRLARPRKEKGILGVNLGKNRDTKIASADYIEGIQRMAPLADYLVVNISSPNTPGLRDLQRRAPLKVLMAELIGARTKMGASLPLLIKISPDLTQEERSDVAAVALELTIDGIIIANTTIGRPTDLKSHEAGEKGGLSGPQLFEMSTKLLFEMYRLTSGRIPLVGVGGISSAEDAYAKIRAGASLVQIHSALIFFGLSLVSRIKEGLVKLLSADGFSNITDAIGANHTDRSSHSMPSQASQMGDPPSSPVNSKSSRRSNALSLPTVPESSAA
jgi:dihydroorotate dehydrogenase